MVPVASQSGAMLNHKICANQGSSNLKTIKRILIRDIFHRLYTEKQEIGFILHIPYSFVLKLISAMSKPWTRPICRHDSKYETVPSLCTF